MKTLIILLILPFYAHAQIITSIAGGGTTLGDGGPATSALLYDPGGCVLLNTGVWYIASGLDNRIRKIDNGGIISTFAGTGSSGYTGDGGPATVAKIDDPAGIAIDTKGNLFFSDPQNNVIRKIKISTGIISTICGNGTTGYNGDNIPASSAQLNDPNGICVDKLGNVFIADVANQRVRKIDTLGMITTVAGTGIFGFTGDGGPATLAQLKSPVDVTFDNVGNLYISDGVNRRIRRVSVNGTITTFAGNGNAYYVGDGMAATNAQLAPIFIKFDNSDNLYVGDQINFRIYKIDNSGIFHWIAGNGTAFNNGDGAPATSAGIYWPGDIVFDTCNNLYFTNINYDRIRKITFNYPPCDYLSINEQSVYPTIPIYPNPSKDVLTIENITSDATYQLINILGSEIQQGILKQTNNEISIAHLSPGMYMLVLTNEEGKRTTTKIIKQ